MVSFMRYAILRSWFHTVVWNCGIVWLAPGLYTVAKIDLFLKQLSDPLARGGLGYCFSPAVFVG